MPRRLEPLEDGVRLRHDGSALEARAGEPLLLALLAEKGFVLSRSPKLHRPRGPYCARGACEGCLVRVDGVPNVMACQTVARAGQEVETQNVVGSRELDLLGATDYLFPRGMDHHRLFAGVRGVSSLVQAFARRVSGLGRLPEAPVPARPGEEVEVDALIVGGGAAGLGAARVLGARALLVDDQLELGGALSALEPARGAALVESARASGCRLLSKTSVIGLYTELDSASGRRLALAISPDGPIALRARRVLIATGTHDPVPTFENNDLPGIVSARAALMLLRQGVLVGERVALVGEGRFASSFAEASAGACQTIALDADMVLAAHGRPELSALRVSAAGVERRHSVDAVLIDGPGAPAFELAVQAGGATRFDPARGYVPLTDERGLIAPDVLGAGSLVGARDSVEDGARVAASLLESL